MPEFPIIVLPKASRADITPRTGGPSDLHFPSRSRQVERVESRIKELADYFRSLRTSPAGQLPEEVVVFEIRGTVEDFLKAVSNVEGLSFLGEQDIENLAPDEDFWSEGSPEKGITGRLFMVMTNKKAIDRLLSLWNLFDSGKKFPIGATPFRNVFAQLKDIHRWSAKDRLAETGAIDYWREASAIGADSIIPFEIELWYREEERERKRASTTVSQILGNIGGQVISDFCLKEIRYHALTVSLPAYQVIDLVNNNRVELLGESAIMYFRPSGQNIVPDFLSEETTEWEGEGISSVAPSGEPIIALLDGLPVENHSLLAGHLRVDDPDDYAHDYPAADRQHGTSMASIIIHGDLSTPSTPLSHLLYVRPIMRPDPQPWLPDRSERIPFGVNQIDLTYRAVRRLFKGEGEIPPVAPNVKIINLSIGDPEQPFNMGMSAWGRLLDWLAVEYNVLFCVSTGNKPDPIELNIERDELSRLSPEQLEAEVFKALFDDIRNRRIISPSESINSLTIGSWHEDSSSQGDPQNRIDVVSSIPMSSPLNRLGSGFRNSIKPDILLPGGRQLFREKLGTVHEKATLNVDHAGRSPGIQVASPGTSLAQLNDTKFSRGSSNANAFASRTAGLLYDQLVVLRQGPFGDQISDDYTAVLLKAMLVHNASWGNAHDRLKSILTHLNMTDVKFRGLTSRFLGYGFVNPDEKISSQDSSAVMLGCGQLRNQGAHIYEIPLPPSLNLVRGFRRLVVTLAWNSPVSPRLRNYRDAAFWFEAEFEKLSTTRQEGESSSVRNGTIQHEIFEGINATEILDGSNLVVKVNCRADAVEDFDKFIKYGLVVTIETAEELHIPVYEEVVARIRPAVSVRS